MPRRSENITVIFVNNANFAMTGGQMAPTTLPGQKTSSSVHGRDTRQSGFPVRAAEMLATLDGASYVVRRSLHDPKNIRKAKKSPAWRLKPRCAGWAFRWWNCFPPAPPTGACRPKKRSTGWRR